MLGDARLERCRLFVDDADRERFLDRLAERVESFNIRLYLFVLMTNHVHLVFETPAANCGKFMQSLSTAYTVYYNLRHGRHGHLLDGRYKAKLVQGDQYLLALTRYVHLNPVCVGALRERPIEERIEALRTYRWSTYPSYTGRSKALDFVTYGPILAGMGGKRRQWPKRYREFVETGLAESDAEFEAARKQSPLSIGGEQFQAWVQEQYGRLVERHGRPEDIAFRHHSAPLEVDKVLRVLAKTFGMDIGAFRVRRRNSPLRAVAASCLIRYAGQSQRDVARLLDVGTGSAIGKQLRRLDELSSKDRALTRLREQAAARLEQERQAKTREAVNS
jgi:REP element-mobilizing transposase RayT